MDEILPSCLFHEIADTTSCFNELWFAFAVVFLVGISSERNISSHCG